MKRELVALLVPLFITGRAAAQTVAPAETLLVVHGIVQLRTDQADSGGTWVVFLPGAVTVRTLRTNTLVLAEGEHLAGRYVDRFVEVQARVAVGRDAAGRTVAIANSAKLREVHPDGMVERDVDLSLSEHATVQLAVVPRSAVWRDSAGAPSGVTPTVLFSIVNHSQTELRFFFPTNEVVCLLVRPVDEGGGHEVTWRVSGRETLVTLRMGSQFRQILPISDKLAGYTGRYVVRAALCGADEFHAEAEFDIVAP